MGQIKKIIDYFFYHSFPQQMVNRIHTRLLDNRDEKERDEALMNVWNEIGFPESDQKELDAAYMRLQKRLGLPPEVKQKPRHLYPSWLRVAAIWLLPVLLFSSSVYMFKKTYETKQEMLMVSMVEHFVPFGKRELVILPDSSKVWLNSGSMLVYPSQFMGNVREVYLSGEGYFEVKKQKEQSFIVNMHHLEVKVLGTRFNVRAYPELDDITTTLESGKVQLNLKDSSLSYVLSPNEQLIYHIEGKNAELRQVNSSDYSDWKNGGLLFDNYSFREILRVLEKSYGVKIHLYTSRYDENQLTVHFNKNESLENILMLLKELIPGLNYQMKGKEILLE